MEYKFTLNLPATKFSMRAQLHITEVSTLKFWDDISLYMLTQSRKKLFTINDGPPYANGQIHMGHAFNKILKDIIGKFKLLSGYSISFIPGWDCHGLPIELSVEKLIGKLEGRESEKKFKNECRKYADKQINIQKSSFIRLGINAKWESFYKTMSYTFESKIMENFKIAVKKGYIYNGKKPVYWCFECCSALAEAEIDYKTKESISIYVFFAFVYSSVVSSIFLKNNRVNKIGVIVWTTTPWTLLFNEAVALNASSSYVLIKHDSIGYLLDKKLLSVVVAKLQLFGFEILKEYRGKSFENDQLMHPYKKKIVKIILSDHVKNDTGSGCVHIAPAYGYEDYKSGLKYGLVLENSIDKFGYVIDKRKEFFGLHIYDVNNKILNVIGVNLLFSEKIQHRYPHCWRHGSSLVFRTTEQWFVDVSKNGLRNRALKVINNIKWIPSISKEKMKAMLTTRPDWCISRQRIWGVPIILFVDIFTGKLHPDIENIMKKTIELVKKDGIDVWYNEDIFELLNIDKEKYSKVNDILDVWYDSSVVHRYVSDMHEHSCLPFDICIEGADQHRGWFQCSLLSSLINNDTFPSKQILVHGFVLDGNGKKMSKSLGNNIIPMDIINKYGADIVRLWVSSVNYCVDVNISNEILMRVCEAYRKIRNTIRFLLSNIYDFDPVKHLINRCDMLKFDTWVLFCLNELKLDVLLAYENYNFHMVYKKICNFCIDELGSKYLDIIKDRLYTTRTNSVFRRSAQTVMYYIVNVLVRLMAPILSFTSEEAWSYIPGKKDKTVFLSNFDDFFISSEKNFKFIKFWDNMFFLKIGLNKLIEKSRVDGFIGTGLEIEIDIFCNEYWFKFLLDVKNELQFFFLVSHVSVKLSSEYENDLCDINIDGFCFKIYKSNKKKCDRCWHRVVNESVVSICKRCIGNLYGREEYRLFV